MTPPLGPAPSTTESCAFQCLFGRNSVRKGNHELFSSSAKLLLALGGIALFGAYRYGENASVVTAATSLYPFVTVIFAIMFLREKPNKLQLLGLCFAAVAIILLSL